MPIDLSKDVIVRWNDPDPAHVPLLKQAGIAAVLLAKPVAGFSEACSAAGIATIPVSEFQFVDVHALPAAKGANIVLTSGLWPGVTRPPEVAGRGDETASASRDPWLDANSFWVEYLRAMYPSRPAVLGYLPELGDRGVPFDTLELALIDSWIAGGNYILAVEPSYRAALLRNDPKALAAWKQLGRTAGWLQANRPLFRQNIPETITTLVDEGGMLRSSRISCTVAMLPLRLRRQPRFLLRTRAGSRSSPRTCGNLRTTPPAKSSPIPRQEQLLLRRHPRISSGGGRPR
jgi:hypothetical protein